jgi:hypothetical protein
MFKFDLINKLAMFLLKEENERKVSFLSIVVWIISFLSFFYFINTELRNFILYLSFSSLAFFISFLFFKMVLENFDFYFVKIIFGKRNSTYDNEYVESIILTNIALLGGTFFFISMIKKLNPDISQGLILHLLLLIYALANIIFLILMVKTSFKQSLVLFFTNMDEVRNSSEPPYKYFTNHFKVNENPKKIYEANKEILKKSYDIKMAFWSLLSILMIFIAIGNIDFVILNISAYPFFKMPIFTLEIKGLILFLTGYCFMIIGWVSILSAIHIALKTLKDEV